MTKGIDLSFIVQPLWSRVSAIQWHGSLTLHYKPTVVLCGAKLLLDFSTLLFCEAGFTACVCVCVACVCAFYFCMYLFVWLGTCERLIFLPCRHPEHWLVTTSIPSFCPRARSSLCRDIPPVLGSSTPDSPPPSVTTASSGPAPSLPNLRYLGRHGATFLLSSQAPSPPCIITTMGIPKVRWVQIQMAAINRGYWSPCPVLYPWPDYRRPITTESNRRVWGRELTALCLAPTQLCCSLITPTGRWRRHHRWKRTHCPASQETWAGKLKRNRALIQVSRYRVLYVYSLLFIPHKAVRIGVRDGGARRNRCHSERAISLWGLLMAQLQMLY